METVEKFEVVTLCGSSKFKAQFESEAARLTLAGKIVINLGVWGHVDMPGFNWERTESNDLKLMLDRMHFEKIRMADRVHIIDVAGYVGVSTAREIEHAEHLGKKVTYFSELG